MRCVLLFVSVLVGTDGSNSPFSPFFSVSGFICSIGESLKRNRGTSTVLYSKKTLLHFMLLDADCRFRV